MENWEADFNKNKVKVDKYDNSLMLLMEWLEQHGAETIKPLSFDEYMQIEFIENKRPKNYYQDLCNYINNNK